MGQNPASKYTPEFRRETADYVIASGRPITECCRELGLNSKTVNDWVLKRRRELGGEVPAGDSDAELRRLNKRVRELEMENEFLKKSRGLLRQDPGVAERYLLMEAERASFPMGMMARLLGVSRSGLHAG